MSQANPHLEDLIGEFSSALNEGSGPDIEDFLPVHESGRITVLKELVATELESRIKGGTTARVEDYFLRFPEIERHPDVLVDLLQFEYTTRARLEADLDIAEYQSRFPALVHLLREGPSLYQRTLERELDPGTDTAQPVAQPLQQSFALENVHSTDEVSKIWLARDEQLDRNVAIKELPDNLAGKVAARTRFVHEAKITGQLEHSGIIPIYSLGELKGRPACAMPLVKGRSLRGEIRDFHNQFHEGMDNATRELNSRRLLRRMLDVCNTIHYAHSRNILHRDIKPDNILIGEFGETLVVNWGFAQKLDNNQCEDLSNHGADTVVGTAGYMSPEQADGRYDQLDTRSDVYSLGATLFMTLTHRHPSQRTLVEENYRLSTKPLAAICEKAMDPDPSRRYESARAMANDIELYLADQPCSVYTETTLEKCRRFLRRNERLVAAIIGLLLTLVVVLTLAWFIK